MKITVRLLVLSSLLVLCCPMQGHAQKTGKAAIDSLQAALPNAKEDTDKVRLLDNLSFAYRAIDPDEGIKYGETELELASRLGWQKGIGWANNDLGVNYEAKGDNAKALEYYFSSLKINRAAGNRNGMADNLGNIGVAYAGLRQYGDALDYYAMALKQFEQLRDKNGMANALGNAGIVYIYQSNYPMALENYSKAIKIFQELGNKAPMAAAYANLGLVYADQNDYKQALDYYSRALKINEELGNRPAAVENLVNIAAAYKCEGDYAKGLLYENKAMTINEKAGEKLGVARNLTNIGNLYSAKGNYSLALENMLQALKMAEQLDNKYLTAVNLGNIAVVYREQHNYIPALLCHFKAAAIDSQIADNYDQSNNIGNTGITYLYMAKDTGRFAKALPDSNLHVGAYVPGMIPLGKHALLLRAVEYLNKAIAKKKEMGDMDNLQSMFQRLSQADTLLGDYKGALVAYKQYASFKDSVFSGRNKITIANFETERDIALNDKQAQIDSLTAAKGRNDQLLQVAGGAVVVLLVLVIGLAFLAMRRRRRSYRKIETEPVARVTAAPPVMPVPVVEIPDSTSVTEAKRYDNVTAIVTDFVNFTNATARMSPTQLVEELQACFNAFDEIMAKHNIKKIKTLGDAYLAVSGIPKADPLHADYAVTAAIEINNFMHERKRKLGDKTFEVRIGIHSGSIIAGMVGAKKSGYDTWGESVSTAMCMEQNSEAGKITISQTTYDLVKDKVGCTYRGKIALKNNETMNMYFVA